ncbi:MAG: PIN domain-containing protein [Myxococcota bacterium]
MIPAPFIVVLDANVLYPFTLRDTLLRAAAADFYQLRWTTEILGEMERNLLKNGVMSPAQAAHLRSEMETYFPEARVDDYESLVDAMKNDEKDRHVAAAAVLAGAQVIVTSNLRDFAPLPTGIEAQSPDHFLCNLFDLDPDEFTTILREQSADLNDPPISFDGILDRLSRVAPEFVRGVRDWQQKAPEST